MISPTHPRKRGCCANPDKPARRPKGRPLEGLPGPFASGGREFSGFFAFRRKRLQRAEPSGPPPLKRGQMGFCRTPFAPASQGRRGFAPQQGPAAWGGLPGCGPPLGGGLVPVHSRKRLRRGARTRPWFPCRLPPVAQSAHQVGASPTLAGPRWAMVRSGRPHPRQAGAPQLRRSFIDFEGDRN
jgi:hypothetical protein